MRSPAEAAWTTVCVSDKRVFAGCPVCTAENGSTCVTTSDFEAVVAAHARPNHQVLFRRGGSFTAKLQTTLPRGGGVLGAFGTRPKPSVFTSKPAGRLILLRSNWVVQDLDFTGPSGDSTILLFSYPAEAVEHALLMRNRAAASPPLPSSG